MNKRIVAICLIIVFAFFADAAMSHDSKFRQPAAQESTAPMKASPAEGYNVQSRRTRRYSALFTIRPNPMQIWCR
jgi:hypothetical protein